MSFETHPHIVWATIFVAEKWNFLSISKMSSPSQTFWIDWCTSTCTLTITRWKCWHINTSNPNDLYFWRSTLQKKAQTPIKTRGPIWVPSISKYMWWFGENGVPSVKDGPREVVGCFFLPGISYSSERFFIAILKSQSVNGLYTTL